MSLPANKTRIRPSIRYRTGRPISDNEKPHKLCRSLLTKPLTILTKQYTCEHHVHNYNSFPTWLFHLLLKSDSFELFPKLLNCKVLYLSQILKKQIWSIKILHSNDQPLFLSVQKLGSSLMQTCMHVDKCLVMHMIKLHAYMLDQSRLRGNYYSLPSSATSAIHL